MAPERTARLLPGLAAWAPAYLRAREREGRLLPDELVAILPDLPDGHPLRDEWRQRADSVSRLTAYLRRRRAGFHVLEVGSGNGWLANRIAALGGCEVVGIDTGELELEQARRVFGATPNLRFVLADVTAAEAPDRRPDVIVLASVIQYVADLRRLFRTLLDWVPPGGEVHVLDSPFYGSAGAEAARARTRRYYERLGVPEMAEVYHAHTWDELAGFDVELRYRPDVPWVRFERRVLRRPRSPFPWLRIARDDEAGRGSDRDAALDQWSGPVG